MALSLADQERVRRDFIVNAAHELRTPLTNLQGYLEGCVTASSPPRGISSPRSTRRWTASCGWLQSLDSLADGEGGGTAAAVEVDLAQGLRAAAELARPAFDARQSPS